MDIKDINNEIYYTEKREYSSLKSWDDFFITIDYLGVPMLVLCHKYNDTWSAISTTNLPKIEDEKDILNSIYQKKEYCGNTSNLKFDDNMIIDYVLNKEINQSIEIRNDVISKFSSMLHTYQTALDNDYLSDSDKEDLRSRMTALVSV